MNYNGTSIKATACGRKRKGDKIMKAALIQMKVLPTPAENLEKAKGMIAQAAEQGCELAILGEMFVCPYNNALFQKYGMPEDSDFVKELAGLKY